MTGRISTNLLYQLGGRNLVDLQAQTAKTQQQLATGKKLLSASDDPAATAAIMNLDVSLKKNQQFQRNSEMAESRLQLQESLMGEITNALQRVRELTIQGKNDTNSGDDRSYLAGEIDLLKEQILDLVNHQDVNHGYVFSGSKSDTQPFVELASGVYDYAGDNSDQLIKISHSLEVKINESGREVFGKVPRGNGHYYTEANAANTGTGTIASATLNGVFVPEDYTLTMIQVVPSDPITYEVRDSAGGLVTSGAYVDGGGITFAGATISLDGAPQNGDSFAIKQSQYQDIFTTLQTLVDAFSTDTTQPADSARLHNQVLDAFFSLDQAMINVERARADTGGRLNILESQKHINDSVILTNQKNISSLKDLNYYEAISKYQQQLVSFEAAQKSFVQIQSLNLFSLI